MRLNPTSPIRRGYEFQDLWTLSLCLNWLKKPESIKSIHIETYHDEIASSQFFIDDVSVIDSQGYYHFYQLKHLQNADTDYWTWEDLLSVQPKKKGGLTTSILQKWANSILNATNKDRICEAIFVTNGKGESNIVDFVESNLINIDKLKQSKPEIYNEIEAQFTDGSSVSTFFSEFQFLFNQSSAETLDMELRQVFYKELKGTESGYNNLKLKIKEIGNQSQPLPIVIDDLRRWGEWDDPKPLDEEFEVPIDFELFDSNIHDNLLNELQNINGGIKVFVGKPGSGKSTYLSNLCKHLIDNEIICIRHHYHISPEETNSIERLNNTRVAEALKFQFKENEEALGALAHQNSENISLPEFLNQVSNYYLSLIHI